MCGINVCLSSLPLLLITTRFVFIAFTVKISVIVSSTIIFPSHVLPLLCSVTQQRQTNTNVNETFT